MTGLAEALAGALRDAGRWVAGVTAEVGAASWPVGVAVAAAGLVVLLVGARARRPVAVAGAAGLAALAAHVLALRGAAVPGVAAAAVPVVAAAAGAAVALPLPQVFPALAGALPLAFVADLVAPPGHRLEAAAAGAAVGIVAGLLAARLVASAVAAGVGAVAVVVGVSGALRATGAGRALSAHPVAILGAACILGIAGAAFQYSRAWGRGAAPGKGKGAPPLTGPDGKPA